MTDLFDWQPPPEKAFDGSTYEPEHDHIRLACQLIRVKQLMADGAWRSLSQIAKLAGGTEASVSARLRDLRKPKYGSRLVERRRFGEKSSGLWLYRVGDNGSEANIKEVAI